MNNILQSNFNLAVIPSDPVSEYEKKGKAKGLQEYYNPGNFFKKVFLFSPLEEEERQVYGMHIIPTKDVELKRRINAHKIDIIRAYGGYWPCDMACHYKVSGVPVIVSLHDRRPEMLHDSIALANFIFPVSKNAENLLLSKDVDPAKIWPLPNRVDLDVMKPLNKNSLTKLKERFKHKYNILHVGRKSPEKNLDTLMKAVNILGDEYALISVGGGQAGPYIELSKKLNISDRCFFIESMKNEELPEFYSFTDCLCNPSRTEAMSFALIEGLACESVVITSNVAAQGANIKHGINGLVIDGPENANLLADLIRSACTDQALRRSIKTTARKSVEMFEKSRIDSIEIGYYKSILHMKKKGLFKLSAYKNIINSMANIYARFFNKINTHA